VKERLHRRDYRHGLQFGTLLSGAVITETVARPGVGKLLVDAISNGLPPAGCRIAVAVIYHHQPAGRPYAYLDSHPFKGAPPGNFSARSPGAMCSGAAAFAVRRWGSSWRRWCRGGRRAMLTPYEPLA
jgi:hypothetical protein